jgi:hypothetical protein
MLIAMFVAGCASVPMASMDDDATAKSFVVASNKSAIYLYRNESLGAAIPMTVTLNGKVAGQSAAKTYFVWIVDPGTHELSSVAENTSVLKLNTEAGKAYFVWQEVKMGMWMARTLLQQVDDATGRRAVAECKRAQSNF